MVFSNSSTGLGIVEQTRVLMRVDATQWPTARIVASTNNYLETVTGYAIGADRRFQWDDTNHTKLPIGTTKVLADQKEYSFLTDEQGNTILNLLRIDILDPSGLYRQLIPIDQKQIPMALDEFEKTAGLPQYYDKIADNIIRIYPKSAVNVTAGLKFYFQRTPSYLASTDTTKEPGVPPLLHRGFVIASAYDGALALGLDNLKALQLEMERERIKMEKYFENRLTDEQSVIRVKNRSSR